MDIPYRSFVSSKPFLIIGPNGSTFYIHGHLIDQCSSVLAVSVNGQMMEAETKIIKIEVVDGDLNDDTVMRFIEFAYRGDYTVPSPDVVLFANDTGQKSSTITASGNRLATNASMYQDEEVVPEPKPEPICEPRCEPEAVAEDSEALVCEDDVLDFEPIKKTKKRSKVKKHVQNEWYQQLKTEIQPHEVEKVAPVEAIALKSKAVLSADFCALASVQQPAPGWEPADNAYDACEDYTKVLLSHARLYVFSDRYECDGLRDLCLQKLRLTLSRFTLHQKRLADIVHLAGYTYAHTTAYGLGRDKLRSMIIDYMACAVERFLGREDLRVLLRKDGDFAVDLMEKMGERLC